MTSMTVYECPYCAGLKPSPNGTGSDVACCGEVGHSLPTEAQDESESAKPFSHAEIPLRPALRLYRAFSAGVTRTWICWVAGFLMGGLPLGRLGFSMPELWHTQIIVDNR
jgi:hypothetical protein